MNDIEQALRVGKILMEGAEGECMATKDYCRQLADIFEISEEYGELCAPDFAEIIADELNHANKLQALFAQITSIKPKEDL